MDSHSLSSQVGVAVGGMSPPAPSPYYVNSFKARGFWSDGKYNTMTLHDKMYDGQVLEKFKQL
ncbi:hypothetical protein BKA82DRAFT_1002913 [Pisolithus tinctorius]|uniref:Uncharacterized protein n=1 Tax=Pisolithus tinctorius Marx 270 TaxID=870435 RepID=A0A0C3P2S3_PISTI|nr:hypothetical protein BKA82DRAFT_1002913 [Pisolithus tinctorius]KIO01796.1 hypothetical protein M404DRAFT_1002913 [Pisolithus tinctorius Marx 270]